MMAGRYASVPPVPEFRELLLMLRGRAGLSQRELATLLGLSERAIRAWETGDSYPSADRLKALIALYLQQEVFTPDQERDEAAALWDAARAEAPRLRVPFEPAWFTSLLVSALPASRPSAAGAAYEPVRSMGVAPQVPQRQDWGEAPDVGTFHGRAHEL